MPKFLNNIDLNSNQLLSPVIHVSTQSTHTNGPAGDATGTEGQIFYNEHAKALFYRDNTAWRPVGDITGVAFTTDDGTTISDTAGSAAFTIAGGAGITTSSTGSTITIVTSNDQNTSGSAATVGSIGNLSGDVTSSNRTTTLSAAQTNITSIYNTSLTIGGDAETMIDFGTSNEIKFKINNSEELQLTGTALVPIVDNGLDLGTSALGFKNVYLANNANSNVGTNITFNKDRNGNGSAGQDGDDIGQFHFHSFNDNSTPEAIQYGRIRAEIDDASDGSEAGRMTFSVRAKDNIYNGLKIVGSEATNGVVDVTIGNGATSTTTIAGNLTVTGDQTTVNSTVVTIADPLFELGASGSDDNLDRGIIMKYNNSGAKKAFMGYDDSTGKFTMITEATDTNSVISGTAGTLVMSTFEGALTGAVTGNASTATLLQNPRNINGVSFNGSDDITITAAGSTLSDTVTVAKGGTGLTSLTAKNLLIGAGTANVALLAPGATGSVLQVNASGSLVFGTAPSSSTAATVIVADQGNTADATMFLTMINAAGDGTSESLKTHANATYSSESGVITAQGFSGSLTGNVTGTATNLTANTSQAVPVGTVELGHATDTTIARSAAGKATIEGNLIGVVKTFTLNDTAPVQSNNDGAASTVFTITHGMGDSRFYKVEVVLNSGDYDTVFADIARPTNATITVTFASNVALGAYAAMVTRMA